MKVIIPVAGVGTRLRPHTYTQPKPLIPVAGKPIIGFIIDQLVNVGVTEFVFIIGYLGEKIRDYIESEYNHLDIQFVYQHERLGIGHAIWIAREQFSKIEEILIVLGDTIFDADLQQILSTKNSCIGIKKVKDPREFGVIEFDAQGHIKRLVEKPTIPKSNMAMVGLYKITAIPTLLEALEYNIKNDIKTVGEYQLTDALMYMVNKGIEFTHFTVKNWFDCGKKEILLETNEMLLKHFGFSNAEQKSFANTIIIPPVNIGNNCSISNAIIGPNVTIGNEASINQSIIQNSIIGSYASIEEMVLKKSIIGSDTSIKGQSQSLNIGDNTEIDFS